MKRWENRLTPRETDGVLRHPHKKSQKKLLTNEQKWENKTFASERIKVEQSMSGGGGAAPQIKTLSDFTWTIVHTISWFLW